MVMDPSASGSNWASNVVPTSLPYADDRLLKSRFFSSVFANIPVSGSVYVMPGEILILRQLSVIHVWIGGLARNLRNMSDWSGTFVARLTAKQSSAGGAYGNGASSDTDGSGNTPYSNPA